MNSRFHLLRFLFVLLLASGNAEAQESTRFDIKKDLLLLHYDFKTDVDDLHSVAAFRTLIATPDFANINYHAVAGTYGEQEGLYVPPNELCKQAFGNKWSDAHKNFEKALKEVDGKVKTILSAGGDIWIAEGGQSDFSAALIKKIQSSDQAIDTKTRIHIVQHSNWNEESTSKEALAYAKENTDYKKIPDGNAVGNGTPGFLTKDPIDLENFFDSPAIIKGWQTAIDLANQYNGKENRYLNEAVDSGGLDFSDFSEVCWILELGDFKDSVEFFEWASK